MDGRLREFVSAPATKYGFKAQFIRIERLSRRYLCCHIQRNGLVLKSRTEKTGRMWSSWQTAFINRPLPQKLWVVLGSNGCLEVKVSRLMEREFLNSSESCPQRAALRMGFISSEKRLVVGNFLSGRSGDRSDIGNS